MHSWSVLSVRECDDAMMKKCGLVMYLSEFKMFCKLIFMRKNYIEMSISGSQLHNKDWSAEQ